MGDVPGDWYVDMYWVVDSDPGARKEPLLIESSISLNVLGPLTEGLTTECVVRYDVDNRLTNQTFAFSRAHLNVLQPGKLADRVHYPVVGEAAVEWSPSAVLRFFTSDALRRDLSELR